MGRTGNAKSRLIAMAMALMYVRGYTAVGVHEISTQAGVYKGSFSCPLKQALILCDRQYRGTHRGRWEDVDTVDGSYVRAPARFAHTKCDTAPSRAPAVWLSAWDLALDLGETLSRAEAARRLARGAGDGAACGRRWPAARCQPSIRTTAQTMVAYFGVRMCQNQQTPEVLTQLAHSAVALVEAAAGASLSAEHG
jgi:hypothetical protein